MKIKGIKKAAGNTNCIYLMGWRNEIVYDRSTGEVWTRYISENSCVVCDDPNVITVGSTREKLTMKQIREMIGRAIG